tara:strand:+ start:2410 stop:3258 length:849 start_codon:yes stop_codon:yes gene_type:complete
MPDIKNYIIANNVKNPFQMRAMSPLNAFGDDDKMLAHVQAPQITATYEAPAAQESGVDVDAYSNYGPMIGEARVSEEEDDDNKKTDETEGEKVHKFGSKEINTNKIQYVSEEPVNLKNSIRYSPLNYSTPNPFTPREQGVIGQVYNPSGNDISEFEQGQAFNKFASNPNTLNEPPIPTEADMTMTDIEMGNQPLDPFGDDLSGEMLTPLGLPEQGMKSTRTVQSRGVNTNLSKREARRQKRKDDRYYRKTGNRRDGGMQDINFRNFAGFNTGINRTLGSLGA